MDIGIDLGATNSVIAVKGRVDMANVYPPGLYLEECDATILPSPKGNPTIPSVMWWHPDEPDRYVFGDEAKQMAEEGKCPIMFSKRCIGSDEKLMLNGRAFTAKEVAERFLRHMKEWAETVTGQKVNRAVVTHPAYFTSMQREETLRAALAADLDITPTQLIMEPVAAALAYLRRETKDPLRALIYDLGGSTFNVAVMERYDGVVTARAIDGDLFLGGQDFDKALVNWMTTQIKVAGRIAQAGHFEGTYVRDHYEFLQFHPLLGVREGRACPGPILAYDMDLQWDRARIARLWQLAETTKIRLSEQRSDRIPVSISRDDLFVDSDDNVVPIVENINGRQFAELINEYLEKTIDYCHRALAKAGIALDEIDCIFMAGSSTYGPWVRGSVCAALARESILYHPDLIIAAGATQILGSDR